MPVHIILYFFGKYIWYECNSTVHRLGCQCWVWVRVLVSDLCGCFSTYFERPVAIPLSASKYQTRVWWDKVKSPDNMATPLVNWMSLRRPMIFLLMICTFKVLLFYMDWQHFVIDDKVHFAQLLWNQCTILE